MAKGDDIEDLLKEWEGTPDDGIAWDEGGVSDQEKAVVSGESDAAGLDSLVDALGEDDREEAPAASEARVEPGNAGDDPAAAAETMAETAPEEAPAEPAEYTSPAALPETADEPSEAVDDLDALLGAVEADEAPAVEESISLEEPSAEALDFDAVEESAPEPKSSPSEDEPVEAAAEAAADADEDWGEEAADGDWGDKAAAAAADWGASISESEVESLISGGDESSGTVPAATVADEPAAEAGAENTEDLLSADASQAGAEGESEPEAITPAAKPAADDHFSSILNELENDEELQKLEGSEESVQRLKEEKLSLQERVSTAVYAILVWLLSPFYHTLLLLEPKLRPVLVEKVGLNWHIWAWGFIGFELLLILTKAVDVSF